jgi:hypothetical protein
MSCDRFVSGHIVKAPKKGCALFPKVEPSQSLHAFGVLFRKVKLKKRLSYKSNLAGFLQRSSYRSLSARRAFSKG